ncbi:hypothetical protein [Paenibacillus rigui]|uniref:WYL domain-containing protein n=1 Tax=Paenibacillus rigui TaxID=554312 RepID=A0A229ULE5_9BACL|nr:hypothetical protein [Paenibacillus rigui]OXM84278.1 hypothetical protein CF651_21070 [Paenibacillus rigui]
MDKYVGQTIEIIYLSKGGELTQRRVEVISVIGGVMKAKCLQRNAPRVFTIDNILAVQPVRRVS